MLNAALAVALPQAAPPAPNGGAQPPSGDRFARELRQAQGGADEPAPHAQTERGLAERQTAARRSADAKAPQRSAPAPAPTAKPAAPAKAAGHPPAAETAAANEADTPDAADSAQHIGTEPAPSTAPGDTAALLAALLGLTPAPAAPAANPASALASRTGPEPVDARGTKAGRPKTALDTAGSEQPANVAEPATANAGQRPALRTSASDRDATDSRAGAPGDLSAAALAPAAAAVSDAARPSGTPATQEHTAAPVPGAGMLPLPGAPVAGSELRGASATAAPFEAQLSAALGSPAFAPALGHQLSVMVQGGVQEARLHLNPAEMGPITVQIALDGSTAQVHLAAEQPFTREALQQAMPALASALRDSGLTLTGGGVFEQPREPARDGQPDRGSSTRTAGTASTADGDGPNAPSVVVQRTLRGVVDLFA